MNESKKNESEFPVNPDKLIVGSEGLEAEFTSDDEEYSKIISLIKERVSESKSFGTLLLYAYDLETGKHSSDLETGKHSSDLETGKHLSYKLRKSETFVEFVYNECKPQDVAMSRAGGVIETEQFDVQRIFFPLTRDYHDNFFIGYDADYEKSASLGFLPDKTELITYIRELVAQKITTE